MQSDNNQKGYITIAVKKHNNSLQTLTALIDTGNSFATHGCIRGDIAKDLKLPITTENLVIGTTDSKQNITATGSTSFEIFIEIKDQLIPFRINVIVIENL